MERAKPPPDISPRDFFTRWIASAVAGDAERRRRLGDTEATIVFDLKGPDGGCFTVRIGASEVVGSDGNTDSADLRVTLDVATWRQLNTGELKAPEALLKRRVRLQGDFLLGLKLHLILG